MPVVQHSPTSGHTVLCRKEKCCRVQPPCDTSTKCSVQALHKVGHTQGTICKHQYLLQGQLRKGRKLVGRLATASATAIDSASTYAPSLGSRCVVRSMATDCFTMCHQVQHYDCSWTACSAARRGRSCPYATPAVPQPVDDLFTRRCMHAAAAVCRTVGRQPPPRAPLSHSLFLVALTRGPQPRCAIDHLFLIITCNPVRN